MNRRWWLFLGASLMIFIVNVDATIVNLALASIARDLHLDLTHLQWVINSYLLTTAIFFIVGVRLADRFNKKRIFLAGTLLFAVGSFIAGHATTFPVLISARVIQGIGFAFTLGLALLMISSSVSNQQRAFVLGLTITIASLGQTLGPTLGGVILKELGWQYIFLLNVPFAILSFLLILFFGKPQEVGLVSEKRIDYFGTALFGLSLLILFLTLSLLTTQHISHGQVIIGLIFTFLVFLVFYWKEKRTAAPVMHFAFFANRNYFLAVTIRFLFMFMLGNFLFFIPLYIQNAVGFDPLIAGLVLLVYSSLFGIFSPMAGLWCDHAGSKPPIVFAAITCLVAFLLLASIHAHTHLFLILLGMALFGMSAGIMIPSTVDAAIVSIPKANATDGLGMFFTLAFIGIALGVALGNAQIYRVSYHELSKETQHQTTNIPESVLLRNVSSGTEAAPAINGGDDRIEILSEDARQNFVRALASVMIINVVLAFIISLLGLALRRPHVREMDGQEIVG